MIEKWNFAAKFFLKKKLDFWDKNIVLKVSGWEKDGDLLIINTTSKKLPLGFDSPKSSSIDCAYVLRWLIRINNERNIEIEAAENCNPR